MSITQQKTRRLLLIALWLGMMIGAMGTTVAAAMLGSARFKDVKAGSPYDAAIGEMAQLGIMPGVTGTQFKPNAVVKRGELALILKRFRDSLGTVTTAASSSTAPSGVTSSAGSSTSSRAFSSIAASLPYNPAGYVRFTTTVFSINEAIGTATVTIVRTGGNQGTVSVDYALIPGTAVAGTDYVDGGGTLTFANKETSKKIQILVKDDGKSVSERTLIVELKNPQNGVGIANPAQATLKIFDRFAATNSEGQLVTASSASSAAATTPVVAFSTNAYAAGEDKGNVLVTVVRTGVTTTAFSVTYATTNGSATSNDHSPTNGALSFGVGETSKTFGISIPDDASVDGSRTVNLFLSNPTNGAVVGSIGNATLTIYDNETAAFGSGSLKFSKVKYEVLEGVGKAIVTVSRVGGAIGAASVQYSAAGGSATEGLDFTAVAGTLNFAAGEASRTFEVPIIKDSTGDGGETIILSLTGQTGAALGDPSTSTIVIYD